MLCYMYVCKYGLPLRFVDIIFRDDSLWKDTVKIVLNGKERASAQPYGQGCLCPCPCCVCVRAYLSVCLLLICLTIA